MPRSSITIPIRTCGSRRGRRHLWRRQAPQRSGPETASARRMLQLIARRILETIPVLVLVATITFFMMKAVPGGPLDTEKNIPQEIKVQIEAFYGLDQPVWKQYASYMGNLLRGDLPLVQARQPLGERADRGGAAGIARARRPRAVRRAPGRHPARHCSGGQAEHLDRLSRVDHRDGRHLPAYVRDGAAAGAGVRAALRTIQRLGLGFPA